MNFKVTFHLDGTGIYYDPYEPIHLDALLAYLLAPMQCKNRNLGRDDTPEDVRLPLLEEAVNGHTIWRASALFPEGDSVESIQYWRKRFRQDRLHLTTGSPNLQNATYRDYNTPVPLLCTHRMVGYASGSRKRTLKLLWRLTHLGKKRAHGHGRIINVTAEEIEEDYSLIRDGLAMRWYPHPEGSKIVRPRPPYWNNVGRARCLEVGEEI